MSDVLDAEKKVGAMLRTMSGEVSAAFEMILQDLYHISGGKEPTPVEISCAKWHWMVVKYSRKPEQMRHYVSIIQHALETNYNLDRSPKWKKLMRVLLPEEFIAKFKDYTQVPQIAIMDINKPRTKKKEVTASGGVAW